jgi:aldehyde dehydrogenase (NAD+)
MTTRVADLYQTLPYGPAPEQSAPANQWLDTHSREFGHYIDGKFTSPAQLFETINPANKQPLAKVSQASQNDVDVAVNAARAAYSTWSKAPGHLRARYLYALARQVQKHSRLFAVLETMDNGKPIRETRDIDIPLVARHFYHHAGWAQLLDREYPHHKPLGVVGQIIPWNFPLLMLAWKIAPALAAGNTVVLKPAEWTPLTALLFAEICQAVGLPPGVVNIVTGDGLVGQMIVNHTGIDKIAFTGSTEVGRLIRAATAGSGKKISLELGGKSPFIVFDSADLDSVVEGVVDAIWFNQGQVCCAGSRLLVQEDIAERLISKLRARMEKLRVGDPLDKAVDIGAIVAPAQLQKIERLVNQGKTEGATFWQPSWACPVEGYFYPPTLFTNVSPATTIFQEEIFGPVLVSTPFRTPSEAVALANNTRYGLAASVWSEDINTALDIARQIKAGVVWINSTNLFDAASGFGGYRESGFGREGGREGLFEYLKRETPSALPHRHYLTAAKGKQARNGHPKLPPIDRTPKQYIGGKQARPDSGYSLPIYNPAGVLIGEVGDGNRKDIRNAVEAARAASTSWGNATGHNRAQILYYIAENLSVRADDFTTGLNQLTGGSLAVCRLEVEATIQRLFTYAAYADKYDGAVHHTVHRNVTLAMPEAIGTLAIVCPDEQPLLGFVSLVAPAIAMGNTVTAVPSERFPLVVTDLYQVFDTSDLPGGVVNIVTGKRDLLAKVLAEHNDVDVIWYMGSAEGSAMVEKASISNLKQTWVSYGQPHDWLADDQADECLRHATQVKNIWVPYGV